MYPLEQVYSRSAYDAWRRREANTSRHIDLKEFRQSCFEVRDGPFWEVSNWNELREAVSFMTLMNKRDVLYFRGQGVHHQRCLPMLFRQEWNLSGRTHLLSSANRGRYYALLPELQKHIFKVVQSVGTPRSYILEHVPAAAASILQHYELWPTHFIDLTRSLSTAVAFAKGCDDRHQACLYVFAMPDLRGSITSDIDQHLTLARLEAICPPAAKRPHHQDAYLVSRFPEPAGSAGPGSHLWDDWQDKTDLMRRLVAKFLLRFRDRELPGAPRIELDFLIPSEDVFREQLKEALLPILNGYVSDLGA